jgi:aryl-alcohol dehydrogenase-like predicted oxidoreductase
MRNIPGTDVAVHPLCLGTNVFGWTADEPESFAVLDVYRAAGGNFVDIADSYSAWVPGNRGGESEEIIGRWMVKRGTRDAIVVATKVGSARSATSRPPTCRPSAGAYLDERGERVLAVLDAAAAAHEVPVAAVSLAWLAAQPTVVSPIAARGRPGSSPS